MNSLRILLQVVVALGIINVWIIRANRPTEYRGGDAKSLKDEFLTYGFPGVFYYSIGTLKVLFALVLLAGIWFPVLVIPAAIGMSALMAGAFLMHLKVKDPIKKSLPSLSMLTMSLLIVFL